MKLHAGGLMLGTYFSTRKLYDLATRDIKGVELKLKKIKKEDYKEFLLENRNKKFKPKN
jgi:hypothetical protein